VKHFFLLLIGILAAMVLLFLILIGGLCGWMCDLMERCASRIYRLGRWLIEPLRGEVKK